MFDRNKPEVLVVGAGPVGLFTALCLSRQGITTRIIDENWRPAARSYALALHPDSIRLLAEADLQSEVLDSAYVINRMAIYDGDQQAAMIDFSQLPGKYPFVAALPQDVLESILESALHKNNTAVDWNHRLESLEQKGDEVKVEIDRLAKDSRGYAVAHSEWIVDKRTTKSVPFVIGADGYASTVRTALGIDFKNIRPPRHFAVFECVTDADLDGRMAVVLGDQTTSILWPLPDGRCRWSFELTDFVVSPHTRAKNPFMLDDDDTPELSDANFQHLLATRAPWFQANIDHVAWRTLARFEQRLATRFGVNRGWLVGDAVHMAAPAGVQSMNVGLREGQELATIIADILRRGDSLKRIEEFGAEHLKEWWVLDGLEGYDMPADILPEWVRDRADHLVSAIPASGDELNLLLEQFVASAHAA